MKESLVIEIDADTRDILKYWAEMFRVSIEELLIQMVRQAKIEDFPLSWQRRRNRIRTTQKSLRKGS